MTTNNSDSSWVDEVLKKVYLGAVLANNPLTNIPEEQTMNVTQAKQKILQKMNEAVEKDPRYLALKIRTSTAENKLEEVTNALRTLKSLEPTTPINGEEK